MTRRATSSCHKTTSRMAGRRTSAHLSPPATGHGARKRITALSGERPPRDRRTRYLGPALRAIEAIGGVVGRDDIQHDVAGELAALGGRMSKERAADASTFTTGFDEEPLHERDAGVDGNCD